MTDKRELTVEDLDAFRKEFSHDFFVPENHVMFAQVADTNLWLRRIFVWKREREFVRLLNHLKANPALFCPACASIIMIIGDVFGGGLGKT